MTRTALVRFGQAFVAAALLLGPGYAFAEGAEPADATNPPEEPLEPGAGTRRPAAPDWRKGTITLSASASYMAPLGELASGVAAADVLGGGPDFKGALGLGLSRHLSLEVQGSYGMLGGGATCSGCSGSTTSLGLGFVYHVAQGIAFDPWGSFGIGYRMADLAAPDGQTAPYAGSYKGFDFTRLALGGEFYPLPSLGFGPVLEAAVGSYRLRPDPTSVPSVYAFLSVGLRVTFDPLRGGRVSQR